jgi:hypothetical protein
MDLLCTCTKLRNFFIFGDSLREVKIVIGEHNN